MFTILLQYHHKFRMVLQLNCNFFLQLKGQIMHIFRGLMQILAYPEFYNSRYWCSYRSSFCYNNYLFFCSLKKKKYLLLVVVVDDCKKEASSICFSCLNNTLGFAKKHKNYWIALEIMLYLYKKMFLLPIL